MFSFIPKRFLTNSSKYSEDVLEFINKIEITKCFDNIFSKKVS